LFNFCITPFIRRSEGTHLDFTTLYPVLKHQYLMMQNPNVRFPDWSKCRIEVSDQSLHLGQFWRSLRMRNVKIRLFFKWFNFCTVCYCKGWWRADWHISECTFALWGGGKGAESARESLWSHAILKPVQWQWIGGVCSMLLSNRESFYVWSIPLTVCSLDQTFLDFFW
jgi:hypothetical protein